MSGDFVAREVNWGLGNPQEQKVFFSLFLGLVRKTVLLAWQNHFRPLCMHNNKKKKELVSQDRRLTCWTLYKSIYPHCDDGYGTTLLIIISTYAH